MYNILVEVSYLIPMYTSIATLQEARNGKNAERKGPLNSLRGGNKSSNLFPNASLFCEILPFTVGEGDKNSGKAMVGNA